MRQFAFLLTALLLAAVGGAQTYFPGTAYHPGTTNVFPTPQSRGGTQFPPVTVAAADSTLLTGLVSYWNLDEQSGVRYDSHGSNDLTDNNTVGFDTGVNGAAASFVAANSEWLTSSSTDFDFGDTSFTVSTWVNPTSLAAAQCFVARDVDTRRSFTLDYDGGLRWYINGGGGADKLDYSGGAFVVGQWYHIVASYEGTTKQLGLYVNGGTGQTQTATNTPPAGAANLTVGRRDYPGAECYANARIDEVAIWSRVLTADERTELWNAGAGKFYPFE